MNWIAAASSVLVAALSVPAHAQDQQPEEIFAYQTEEGEAIEALQREFTDAFAVLGEALKADPLTAEQEARLPLAREMTDKVFPEGSFAVVMDQSMKPIMTMMMNAGTEDPRTEVAALSGVAPDDLAELDDDTAQAALDLLDPQYDARNERMGTIVVGLMGDMFEAIEPAYRTALARAFAVRFEEPEMRELLGFFATPVGGKFARESILVQYDPQMMGMMEAMGPAMGEMIPGMLEKIAQLAEDFPGGRTFPELSAAERAELSRLLGKGEAELEALAPERAEHSADDEHPVT